jgi:citronellyl-CoA synthetase
MKDTLRFSDLAPQIIKLLPRVPSMVGSIRKALAIQPEDHQSLGLVLEANAARYSQQTALLYEDQALTHEAFNQRINQYAHYFLAQGVKPGEVVVVLLDNRPELLLMIGAMAKIGAVASLINPHQRATPLRHSIEVDPGAHLVVGEELMAAWEAVRPEVGHHMTCHWVKDQAGDTCPADYLDLSQRVAEQPRANPPTTAQVKAGSRYANVFTSGTTGLPKASRQVHRKWMQAYYWFGKVNLNFRPDDVVYVPIPFYHTNALIVGWSAAAAGGAAMAMRRKFSTSQFWEDVQRYRVSSFIYIGEVCRYLYKAPPAAGERGHRIRKIFGNGLRPDIWQDFQQRFDIPQVLEFYGAADANLTFTNTLNLPNCVGWCTTPYAIVRYDADQETPVLNAEGLMEKVRPGEVGLLLSQVSAARPFDGYVDQQSNTRKLFEGVFVPGDRWFNSGDLMRDLGFRHAQFVDRLGDTFRWKGENVSTIEVEGIISSLSQVSGGAVYGVSIPHTDGKAGMATLTLSVPLAAFDWEAFAHALDQELPRYAVPILVRIAAELETTATHKIKKKALKDDGYQTEDPVFVRLPSAEAFVQLHAELRQQMEAGTLGF